MGEYFKIINKTTSQTNEKPLMWNFDLPWIKGFDKYYSKSEIKEIFEWVINENGWSKDDDIIAKGDYGSVVNYS